MTTKTMTGLMRLRCLDARVQDSLALDKKKILIGSQEQSDFRLSDASVSSYHAFLCLCPEGFQVKDLFSEAGTFVNGKRISECFVAPGDVLTIGTLSFSVEALEEEAEIVNLDANIRTIETVSAIELPAKEGLVFIDGEYCDITFDDSGFSPLKDIPLPAFDAAYVELDETAEALDIKHDVKTKKLEIISYVNGLMLDIAYLDLKDGDYSLSPVKMKKTDILFNTIGTSSKIFQIQNGELRFYPQEKISPSTEWSKISLGEPLFLTLGSEQLSLRFVEHSTQWRGLPLFYRDREFFKQSGKVFASVFLPLLILLFITIPKEENFVQEVAVVYQIPEPKVAQKPTEAQEKSEVKAQELTSKTENSGHKETQQRPEKVEMAAASQSKKVVAKAAAPAAAANPIASTPVKAYEFESSVAMSDLVGDAPKMNAKGSAKGATSDKTFNTGSADDGKLVAGADIGVSKFNGSDKKGSGVNSYGSRGLASKSGFDSSYLEPKTVVLGSMDPELLRKILREYIPQFRHCYQQELVGVNEDIKGVIDMNFTISPEGRVAKFDIRAKDARFSKKGINCMGQVLTIIDFPKPKGGGVVDVRQPLNFFAETEKI